jgi:hypothetical protein
MHARAIITQQNAAVFVHMKNSLSSTTLNFVILETIFNNYSPMAR